MHQNIKTPKQLTMERLTGKNSPQHVFNSVLWDIVRKKGGSISVSGAELRQMPQKALLKGHWDDLTQSMIITAVINKEKLNFVTQGIIKENLNNASTHKS